MNLEKLRLAEASFLAQYPGGFEHPEMVAIGKKHRVDKMSALAGELFEKKKFRYEEQIIEDLVKLVSRSSMVSMFEKPKFKQFAQSLSARDKVVFSTAFKKMFYGNQEKGFNEVLDIMTDGKMAKWSLITISLVYLFPQSEVFVKPTTAKGIIQKLDLGLEYKPRPSYAFYKGYREAITEMKQLVDVSLSPSNAAFTGFLMMAL